MEARICKHEGCALPVKARSMCSKHYQRWTAANPTIREQASNGQLILEAMPGRTDEIAAITGLSEQTVKRRAKMMGIENIAHISSWASPRETGYKFMPVWEAGPGANARLTRAMREEYRRWRQRKNFARRKVKKAGWAGPLGGFVEKREVRQHGQR